MSEAAAAEHGAVLANRIMTARETGDPRAVIVAELEYQSFGCEAIGSPLYGRLLQRAAEDAAAGGIAMTILAERAVDPPFTALALRLMAAVHRLVLSGQAPRLAAFYPSAGGTPGAGDADAFMDVLREHAGALAEGVLRPCQTNEPARSAALLGGFLSVARDTGLPLRILEVGASAGLNLRWDHFRYEHEGESWGPADSPVKLTGVYESPPPLNVPAMVVERRGCDPRPQDPGREETRLNLVSSAWPDQVERFHALEGALEVARRVPATVDEADGVTWVATQLAEPRPGVATVVYHSIVMQYMGEAGRARFVEELAAAGQRALAGAPLAWLSFEPGGDGRGHVNLTTWPGGEQRLVATAGYHGRPVRWLT